MEKSLKRLSLLKDQIQVNKVSGEQGKVHCQLKEDIRVAIITWDFPKTLNALSTETMGPLVEHLKEIEKNEKIGAVVLTGVNNTFSAGANIAKFMGENKFTGGVKFADPLKWGNDLPNFSKPIIAAVNGYCFGGGLEVALMCDIIVASDQASFGLPEIKLGLIPGLGGTQALIRSVGKAKAMEMILTGTPISAQEAKDYNLAAKVVEHDKLLDEAVKLAKKIGKMSLPSVASAKKAVKYAQESSLTQGMEYEKALFNALFGTQDMAEGVSAFLAKRKPKWSHS